MAREPLIIEKAPAQDPRGFLVKLSEASQLTAVYNLHLASLNPSAVRGNHFHPTQTEYLYVLGAEMKLVTVDCDTGTRTEKIIEGLRCPLIIVPPKVVHAIKNIGTERVFLLCYNDLPLHLETDVIKKIILT